MIRIATFFLALMASVGNIQAEDRLPPAPDGKTWKLIWNDEFDGTELDPTKWIYRLEGKRHDGWWDRSAIVLEGKGHLAINTLEKEGDYVTGCIATQGKFERTFGYFVARIQLQKQPGHWSAFWLTCPGVRKLGEGGRDGTEIDIMEKFRLDDRVQHALHWDYKRRRSAVQDTTVPGVMKGWHTFAVWWTPEEYIFYVDGEENWRTRAGGVCQVPLYILLTDEVGKAAGDISEAKLPDQYLIDYVRVYDLVDERTGRFP